MSKRGISYSSLDTPAVLLDMNQLEQNIRGMAKLAAEAKVTLRPHIKFHQCAEIAKMQMRAGAQGVEVGNVDQAEAMAEEGIDDIMVVHPFYGERKIEKLRKVISKPGMKLSIVVDMIEQAQQLSDLARSINKVLPLLIKIDTGVKRYGLTPGKPVLDFARQLIKLSGISFVGLYAHESQAVPTEEGVTRVAREVGSITTEMARMLRREGFKFEHVCVGSSPTFRATCRLRKEGLFPEITEIHPGAAAIGDIMYVTSYGTTTEACALTVLTSIVSLSHPEHAVIDAGYKTFGPGKFGDKPHFGIVKGRPNLWVERMGAESAIVSYLDPKEKLTLGERIEIVPNHGTLVLNIHEAVYGVRDGKIEKTLRINGRGKGS